MDDIINTINNEDLSLNELSEIVKETLAKLYLKLETEVGMHYPDAFIRSIGSDSSDVSIIFVDGDTYSGESYESTYRI